MNGRRDAQTLPSTPLMAKNEVKMKIPRCSDNSYASSDSSGDALVRTRDAEDARKVAPVCLRDALHHGEVPSHLPPNWRQAKQNTMLGVTSKVCSRCQGNAAGGSGKLQGVHLSVTH
jgi:hypothetical protein